MTRKPDTYKIREQIIKESFLIPYGWEEEIYYNKRSKKISFSEPMTHNTWTRSDDIVGRVEGTSISDIEGFKLTDQDEYIEVEDEEGKIAKGFNTEEWYQYYQNSSVITYDEAMDRIIEIAENNDIEPWYQDIIDEIEVMEGMKECDACHKKLKPDNWTKGGTLAEPRYYHETECIVNESKH